MSQGFSDIFKRGTSQYLSVKTLGGGLLVSLLLLLFLMGISGLFFLTISWFHEPFLSQLMLLSGMVSGLMVFALLFYAFTLQSWVTLSTDPHASSLASLKSVPLLKILALSTGFGLLWGSIFGLGIGANFDLLDALPIVSTLSTMNGGSSGDVVIGVFAILGGLLIPLVYLIWFCIPRLAIGEKHWFKASWQCFKTQKLNVIGMFLFSLLLSLGMAMAHTYLENSELGFWATLVFQSLLTSVITIYVACLLTQLHQLENPTVSESHAWNPLFLGGTALAGLTAMGVAFQHNQNEVNAHVQAYEAKTKAFASHKRERQALEGTTLTADAKKYYMPLLIKPIPAENQLTSEVMEKIETPLEKTDSLFARQKSRTYVPELFKKYQHVLDLMEKATHASTLTPLINEYSYSVPLPNFVQSQNLVRLALTQAQHEQDQGQQSKAFDRYMNLMRMGQDISFEGALISSMVGVVIQSEVMRDYLHFATEDALNPALTQRLLGQWKQVLKDQDLLKGVFQREGLVMASTANDPEAFGRSGGALGSYYTFLPYLNYTLKMNKALFQKLDEVYSQPFYQAKLQEPKLNTLLEQDMKKNFLMAIAAPNFIGVNQRTALGRVRIDMAYLKTALIAYKHAHTSYPPTLQALSPEIIPTLPVDPFSGKPYGYALKAKSYTLSSAHKADKQSGPTEYQVSF